VRRYFVEPLFASGQMHQRKEKRHDVRRIQCLAQPALIRACLLDLLDRRFQHFSSHLMVGGYQRPAHQQV
jgi:hypothetical protein